jgi:2-polyprenyl-3-methyl-5-hydroxy-6-metoxy-1,4-benzoquinol methylase
MTVLCHKKKCIICRYLDTKVIFKEFDIDILRCQNCGHIYSSYQADQYYDGYFGEQVEPEEHFWWNEAHKKMYADFCDKFVAGGSGRLLDVGCGLGYFVKAMSSFQDWQPLGYEISKVAVEYAKNELGLRNVFYGKVEESNFPKNYFDVITLWDVIEHIPDPDPLLSYLSSILKENGVLFLHTPNVRIQLPKARIKKLLKGMNSRVHYLEAKDHMNIYSMNTIKRVLCRNGFNTIKFVHLHPIQSISGSKNHLLKLAKTGFFYCSKMLFTLTFGKLNIDNLFVVATR